MTLPLWDFLWENTIFTLGSITLKVIFECILQLNILINQNLNNTNNINNDDNDDGVQSLIKITINIWKLLWINKSIFNNIKVFFNWI